MQPINLTFDDDLKALSEDDLIALNTKLGNDIDEIKNYRRQILAEHASKVRERLRRHALTQQGFSPEQIDTIISVQPAKLNIFGGSNG